MELLENKIYTTDDMRTFFGVSKDTWKKQKDKLLLNFGYYYEYEVEYDQKDHRRINYRILKKLGDYQPIQKKGEKRDKTYEKKIIDVIKNDNVQTARNVSRIIKYDKDIIEFKHTDGTVYENTRVRMRDMFGTKVGEYGTKGGIVEKIWCRLDSANNVYYELEPKMVAEFYKIFSSEKEAVKEEQLTLYCDYENGLITREELYELLGDSGLCCFINAKKEFYKKYGFYPIKVPVYELSAFEMIEQEEKVA